MEVTGPCPGQDLKRYPAFSVPFVSLLLRTRLRKPPDKESGDTWSRPALDLLPEIEILADLRPMNMKINVYCGKPLKF